MHVVQGQRVRRRRHGIAGAGLHIVPPTVVGAGEANNLAFAAVVARQPHGLHDSLGTRHVKRHFLHTGYFAQAFDVVQHTWVVRTEHRAQRLCTGHAFCDAGFVKVQTEQVDTVRAGDIKETVTVHVGQVNPLAFTPETAQLYVLAELFAKLVGHTVLADQLQIRNHGFDLGRHGQCVRAARLQTVRQCLQALLALQHQALWCLIGGKPLLIPVAVSRNPCSHTFGHAQMTAQRRVLSQRQLQALVHFFQQHRASQCTCSQGQCIEQLHQAFPFKTSFV